MLLHLRVSLTLFTDNCKGLCAASEQYIGIIFSYDIGWSNNFEHLYKRPLSSPFSVPQIFLMSVTLATCSASADLLNSVCVYSHGRLQHRDGQRASPPGRLRPQAPGTFPSSINLLYPICILISCLYLCTFCIFPLLRCIQPRTIKLSIENSESFKTSLKWRWTIASILSKLFVSLTFSFVIFLWWQWYSWEWGGTFKLLVGLWVLH